jgi:hypothetical protein
LKPVWINEALAEINKKTDLNIALESLERSLHRRVTTLTFTINGRIVLSFLATSKGSWTTVRITARFTGFENNITHSWMEWPTKGVLENFLLDRIANDLGAPSAN